MRTIHCDREEHRQRIRRVRGGTRFVTFLFADVVTPQEQGTRGTPPRRWTWRRLPARGGPSLVRVDVRRPPPGALPGSSCWSPDAGRSGHHLPRSPRRRHHRRSPRPPRRWRLASESGCGTIRWSFIHRVRLLAVVRVRVEARHHPLFLFLLCMYRLALMSRLVCLLCSRPLLPPPPRVFRCPSWHPTGRSGDVLRRDGRRGGPRRRAARL